MKKIITNKVAAIVMAGIALAPLSSAWADTHPPSHFPRVSAVSILQKLIPQDELKHVDTKLLEKIASYHSYQTDQTSTSFRSFSFNEWNAYEIAAWLVNKSNLIAAKEVLAETGSKNPSIVAAIAALDNAYSPVSDDEEDDDLAKVLLETKKELDGYYKKAGGELLKYPGVKLFLAGAAYNEDLTRQLGAAMLREAVKDDKTYIQVMSKLNGILEEKHKKTMNSEKQDADVKDSYSSSSSRSRARRPGM